MTEPTMAEVARRAEVSISTVSRALRGSPVVNAETTARVQAIAAELGFSVSRTASSLATGRLDRIAVVLSGTLASWFNASLLDAVYSELAGANQELVIYRLLDLDDREAFFTAMPARRNADALLVSSFDLTADEHARLDDARLPVVYVNQSVPGAAGVAIDDDAGARAAARHLTELGHRDLVFAALATRYGFRHSATGREASFTAEARAAGARVRTVTAASPAAGRDVAEELLARELPTAVMAESDELAVGVLLGLRESGVAVPERVSVIGFDDDAAAPLVGLTTIGQPVGELGRQAARSALQLIKSPATARSVVRLEPQLVVRSTTAPPRPSVAT